MKSGAELAARFIQNFTGIEDYEDANDDYEIFISVLNNNAGSFPDEHGGFDGICTERRGWDELSR